VFSMESDMVLLSVDFARAEYRRDWRPVYGEAD
jgi:hypothetical protein